MNSAETEWCKAQRVNDSWQLQRGAAGQFTGASPVVFLSTAVLLSCSPSFNVCSAWILLSPPLLHSHLPLSFQRAPFIVSSASCNFLPHILSIRPPFSAVITWQSPERRVAMATALPFLCGRCQVCTAPFNTQSYRKKTGSHTSCFCDQSGKQGAQTAGYPETGMHACFACVWVCVFSWASILMGTYFSFIYSVFLIRGIDKGKIKSARWKSCDFRTRANAPSNYFKNHTGRFIHVFLVVVSR